jgi:hypothetical protein
MKRTLYYLIFGLLTCCGQVNKNTETVDSIKTVELQNENQQKTDTLISNKGETKDDQEEDCVFNSNYKRLTTEWLNELKIKDFIWRDDLEQALIPKGQDTVFLSQGGCSHFGILVEIKLTNDNHAITDSTFWINKAFELALEYKMEHYGQMIKEGKLRKVQDGKTTVWYEIDDNDEDDNLFYNGIEITLDGQTRRMNMTQYYN